MKWVAVILMGLLMMGCAAYTGPVVTHRQLSPNRYEIMVKAHWTDALNKGCIAFHDYSKKLCEGKGPGLYEIKEIMTHTRKGPIYTQVRIIECPLCVNMTETPPRC